MLLTQLIMQATTAPAPAADQGPLGGMATTLLFPVAMIAIFYFLLIRPQNQRSKKHKEMLAAMKKGDTVVTQGGIIGKVFKISDDEVTIDAGEGVKFRLVRGMIVEVRNPAGTAPAPANDVKES
jgi:preprotein translocase subunit YajC